MVLKTLLPAVPIWITITVAAVAAGVYITFGGLGAVVANDALQALLILAGGIVISVLAWQAVPSWDAVVEAAKPGALNLMQPASDPVMPWPGIAGVFIVGMYFWCTNQFIIQPALGAQTLDDGRWGRGAILVFMVFAVVWTPQISRFPTLWLYLQSILSYLTPPVVAVFLLGLFWRRANSAGALAGLVVGVPLGVLGWVSVELLSLFEVQYLYAAVLMFFLGLSLVIGVSLLTPAPVASEVEVHVWHPKDAATKPGEVWYQDYRLQAAALAAMTLAVVAWWW